MWDFILDCVRALRNWVVEVIQGVISWLQNVVGWFKKLNLNPKKHTPFITKGGELRKMLEQAPVKNAGIFKGVYDQQTDEIVHSEEICADGLDRETREALGNDKLVVLN